MSDRRIHIDRLRALYRLPAALGAPEPVRARLDALAAGAVREALDRRVPAALEAIGLTADAAIAVRHLAVRVRVRSADVADAAIADGWARAVTEALAVSLAPLAASGGADADAAVFPDRFAAERAYLLERSFGATDAWWWRPLLGDGERIPTPREVVARWIRSSPERAPLALIELAREAPHGLHLALSDDDARTLADDIVYARINRTLSFRDVLPEPTQQTARNDSQSTATGASAEGRRAHRFADAESLLDAPELLGLLNPAELDVIAHIRTSALKRLITLCFLLSRRPAALTLLAWTARASPQLDDTDASTLSDREPPPREANDAGNLALHARGRASPRASERERSREDERSALDHRVGCGGLLFLIRRVAASSLLDEHRSAALEDRLIALGWIALHRALDPLPEGARRAAFERDRPLLEVFAGVRALPDELHLAPTGRAASDAAAHLDAIAADLPADLAPCLDGLLTTYGPDLAPFEPNHPHRALAHLLLRPGRLRVTRVRADLHLHARAVDVALRLGGWDIDPGFVPHLGRVIRFHYEER